MNQEEIERYYCHTSSGWLHFDPKKGTRHFEPWWCLLICDEEIPKYYGWYCKRWGMPVQTGSRWRTHISFIRGEKPQRMPFWGRREKERVEFRYTHLVRWENGKHAWLDVYCPRLSEIRVELGLKAKSTYHLTIGRLETHKAYKQHVFERPKIRL